MIGTCESLPQLAADVEAGAVRQHHVEQHEVGVAPRLLERLGDGAARRSVSKPSLRSASASGSTIELSSSTRRIVRLGLLISRL